MKKIYNIIEKMKFFLQGGSMKYWEKRYAEGDNSGNGSYNNLAEFKARVMNEFIQKNKISNVVEWGCGDGNQLQMINYENYLGLDVSETIIMQCKERFKDDEKKRFMLCSEYTGEKFEMAVSLDVIYHLVEEKVFKEYMKNLFLSSYKYVVIYGSSWVIVGEKHPQPQHLC